MLLAGAGCRFGAKTLTPEIAALCHVPESDRETLAQAMGDAIAALEGDLDEGGGRRRR